MCQSIAVMLNNPHNNGIPLDSLPHIQDANLKKNINILLWEANDEMDQDKDMGKDRDLNPGPEQGLKKLSQSNV